MEDSPHLRRPHVTPRLTKRRRDLDAAAKTFREQQYLLVKSPALDVDIAVKALGKELGGDGGAPGKRKQGSGVPDENPVPRFAPNAKRKPGQALKLHITARDLKKGGTEPNWGWVDVPKPPTPEERAASKAKLLKQIKDRPKIRVRQFDINPRTGQRAEGNGSPIEVKSLGPSLIQKTPGGDIGGRAASALGLIVDQLGKLRCPPGTPNANQFTDATGSNCFGPIAIVHAAIDALAGAFRRLSRASDGLRTAQGTRFVDATPDEQRHLQRLARARGSVRGTAANMDYADSRRNSFLNQMYDRLEIGNILEQEALDLGIDINNPAFQNAHLILGMRKRLEELGESRGYPLEMDVLGDLWHDSYPWDDDLSTYENLLAHQEHVRASIREFIMGGDDWDPDGLMKQGEVTVTNQQQLEEIEQRYHDVIGGWMESILHELEEDEDAFSALTKLGQFNLNEDDPMGTSGYCYPNGAFDPERGQFVSADINIMSMVARPYAYRSEFTQEDKLTLVDIAPRDVTTGVSEAQHMEAIRDFLQGQAEITPYLEQYIDYYGQDMAAAMGKSIRARARNIGYHEVGAHARQYSIVNKKVLEFHKNNGYVLIPGLGRVTAHPKDWDPSMWAEAAWSAMFQPGTMPGTSVGFPPDVHAVEGSMLHLLAGRYYQDDVEKFFAKARTSLTPDDETHSQLLVMEAFAELHALRRAGLVGGKEIDDLLETMDQRVGGGGLEGPASPAVFTPDLDVDLPNPDPPDLDPGPPDLDPDLDPVTVGSWDRLNALVSYMHEQGRGPRSLPLELRSRINEEFGYSDHSPTWLEPDVLEERLGVFTDEFDRLTAKFDGADGLTKDEQARLFMAARGVEMILNANARRVQDSDERRAANLAAHKPVEPMKIVPSNLPKYAMDELEAADEIYDIYDVTDIRAVLEDLYPKLGSSDSVSSRDGSIAFGYHASVSEAATATSASAHRASTEAGLSPVQDEALRALSQRDLARSAMEHVNTVSMDENITRAAAARRLGDDAVIETGRVDVGQPTPWVDQDIEQRLVPALEAMDDNPLTERVTVRMGMELDPDSIVVGQQIAHDGFMQGSIVSEEGESMASMLPSGGAATVRIEVPAGHRGMHVDGHDGSDRGLLLPPGKLVVDGIDDDGTIIMSLGEQRTAEQVLVDIERSVINLPGTADGDVRRERARVLATVQGSQDRLRLKAQNDEIRPIDLEIEGQSERPGVRSSLQSSTQQPRVIDSMREYEAVKVEGEALAQQAYEDAIAAGASAEDAEAAKAAALKLALGFDEKNPIQTNNPEIAMQILLDGGDMHENTWMYVQLQSKRQYRTMMKEFKKETQKLLDNKKARKEWIEGGKNGIEPTDRLSKLEVDDIFDLCKVTVPGTSLFCTKHTNRLRDRMPQLGGEEPAKDSKAWKMLHGDPELPEGSVGRLGLKGVAYQKAINAGKTAEQAKEAMDKVQEVNVTDLWIEHLKSLGVHIEGSKDDPRFWKASELTATQSNLKGAKTLGMMLSGFDEDIPWHPGKNAILVTRDGYIIDGHHRWAAVVGMDITDPNHPEFDENMPVIVLDMDIEDAMASAVAFADEMGMYRRDMEDVKQDRLSDEHYVEELARIDGLTKTNIDPTPEDQRHTLSANSVDDYAAKDQAVRSAAAEGLRSSTTGPIGEVPYEDLAEQRGAIIHRWRQGERLPDDVESLEEISKEMERRADGVGLTRGLRSSTGTRGQGGRQRESRIGKLEHELTGHNRRVVDKMRFIDDARVRGDDAEADRLTGEFDTVLSEEVPLRDELDTLVSQRPQKGLASRRNANGDLMNPEEIAAADNLGPIESSTGDNGPQLRHPAKDYTGRYTLIPKDGRTTGSVQRPAEASRDGHWIESADGLLFRPYDRDTKREMEALQSRLNWLRRHEGDRDNIDTELSEIRQRITDIASTKLLKEKPTPVTRKPMPDLTPKGGLASSTRGSGRAQVAEQRRATATPIPASKMHPKRRRERERELQKAVDQYESRLQGKMRAVEAAGNEAEALALRDEFDRISAEERPLRQELSQLKKAGLRTSYRSSDPAVATRMEKKNKKLAERAKRRGVTPFEQTDEHIADIRARATYNTAGSANNVEGQLFQPGGVPPYGWRLAPKEEHIADARTQLARVITNLREATEGSGGVPGTGFEGENEVPMAPEVIDFIRNSTDAEVAAAVEKAIQEYAAGFDRKIRVAVEMDELADVVKSGRYKTTHEAQSDHSTPSTRKTVEMQWGYGPDTPAEERPASGFLNHKVHDQIREDYIQSAPKHMQIPFQNRDHTLLADSDTIRPSGTSTRPNIYGELEVVLRTDVSHRSAMLHGDSARGSRRPAKINTTDPGELLASTLDGDPDAYGNSQEPGRVAELLHASLTGEWEGVGPNAGPRFTAGPTDTSVAVAARAHNTSYVEAVVHGAFDLDDIDHVRIPLHTLNEDANNINLTATDLGLDRPEVLDALREQGLDDDDIERLTTALLTPVQRGSDHPGDSNGLFWTARLRHVMAAEAKQKEMIDQGIETVFPNQDAVDILKAETYLTLPIEGLEPGNAIGVIQQLIRIQVTKRGAEIAKKLRPTRARLAPSKELSVV